MRKVLASFLALGLFIGLLAGTAGAAKKAKPVKTVLHMHGNYPVGDMVEWISSISEGTIMTMDATEPSDPAPKSMSFWMPVGNDQCTGNLLFPSWEGHISGKITGDVNWYAHFLSPPSTVTARMWADVPFSSCTNSTAGVDDFIEPVAEVQVDVPPGQNEVEIVFEKLSLKVASNLIVELHQTATTRQGRVLYDSPDFDTRLEFSCIPTRGKSCT